MSTMEVSFFIICCPEW